MTDLLEKDKDKLLTELSAAATAEKAIHVLENEMDRGVARCAKIEEMLESGQKSDVDTGGSFKVSFLVLLIIGLALCVFGFGPLMMDAYIAAADNARDQVILHGGATVVGLIALYFSGYMYSRPKKVSGKKEYQVDIRVDADRVYRSFRTVILSVDQSLEEIRAAERWRAREKAGSIDGRTVTQSELDLFSDLLAAAYSGDPEYALEKVEQIKYFLHRQQIEVLDYSKENEKYFDLMPGTKAATIRPAMVAQGGLLKKGLASTGR